MGTWITTALLILNLGGDKRDRTADLLHAMQALSQLSYTPKRYQERYYNQKITPLKVFVQPLFE